ARAGTRLEAGRRGAAGRSIRGAQAFPAGTRATGVDARTFGIGRATLERAVVTQALVSGEGGIRSGVLEHLGRQPFQRRLTPAIGDAAAPDPCRSPCA